MKVVYRCCAGLDIHRDTVSACVRRRVRGQGEAVIEEQVFGTFTQDLERLRAWLRKNKVQQVAMESTGVYWIPVWNVLEASKQLSLMLVNPATVRALQGQKTDRIDARRIAEYLQYGLLRGSFIPPKPIRELRELTRMRAHVQQDRNRVINRDRAAVRDGEREAGFGGQQYRRGERLGDVADAGPGRPRSGASGRVCARSFAD